MADNDYDATRQPLLSGFNSLLPSDDEPRSRAYARRRDQAKVLLSSKTKHYVIMSLVALDVASILADILIALISCDMGEQEEPWVEVTREALHLVGLIFSSMFLVELLLTVWAFGLRFFTDWFHCLDAFVILASFIVDVLSHGVLEEIASLVIILRLFRFVKIVEELSVGAAERLEDIEAKLEGLELENSDLKAQVQALREEREEAQ